MTEETRFRGQAWSPDTAQESRGTGPSPRSIVRAREPAAALEEDFAPAAVPAGLLQLGDAARKAAPGTPRCPRAGTSHPRLSPAEPRRDGVPIPVIRIPCRYRGTVMRQGRREIRIGLRHARRKRMSQHPGNGIGIGPGRCQPGRENQQWPCDRGPPRTARDEASRPMRSQCPRSAPVFPCPEIARACTDLPLSEMRSRQRRKRASPAGSLARLALECLEPAPPLCGAATRDRQHRAPCYSLTCRNPLSTARSRPDRAPSPPSGRICRRCPRARLLQLEEVPHGRDEGIHGLPRRRIAGLGTEQRRQEFAVNRGHDGRYSTGV